MSNISVSISSSASSTSLSSNDSNEEVLEATTSEMLSPVVDANEDGLSILSCASAMIDMCNKPSVNQTHKAVRMTKLKRKDTREEKLNKILKNQEKIARKIYKQVLDLFNSYDKESLFLFIDQHVASDFYIRDANKQYLRPFEMRSEGKSNLKALIETYFACVPDSVTFVDKMEILKDGKLIRVLLKHQGTMLVNVALSNQISPSGNGNGSKNDDETFRNTIKGVLKCFLDDRNKIKRLEWNPAKRSD